MMNPFGQVAKDNGTHFPIYVILTNQAIEQMGTVVLVWFQLMVKGSWPHLVFGNPLME